MNRPSPLFTFLCTATIMFAAHPLLATPAEPAAGQWSTFGNGPSHSGFYPATVGTGQIDAGWSKTFAENLNQVAVAGGQVFLTTNQYFGKSSIAAALNAATGDELWRYPLPPAFSVNPPSFADGRVFFQRGDSSGDTYLYALNSATGALLWAAPHDAQWETYMAPAVFGDGVWVDGGTYGGLYGFDVVDGTRRFFNNLPQVDRWTPSYYDGVLYTCVSGIFKAYDPRTGSDLWTRNLNPAGSSSSIGSVVAIAKGKGSVITENALTTVELTSRNVLWRIAGSFTGTPATDGTQVYAISGSAVKAYDAASGALLGSYTAPAPLAVQPLVTNDLVIAPSANATYIFDKASRTLRKTLPTGGLVSYTKGVLYIATSTAKLVTYVIQGVGPEPSPTPAPSPTATPSPTPKPTPTATPNPTATPTPTPSGSPLPSPTPTPAPNDSQPLWVGATSYGNIAYFAFDAPNPRIERYDLQAQTWLAPVALADAPTAFAIDASGIYVSYGRSTWRMGLNGSGATHLFNTPENITNMVVGGNVLYVSDAASHFASANKSTGAPIAAQNFFYALTGLSIDTTHNKIFGRSTGVSPADIVQIGITAAGGFGTQTDSPYHGAYPDAGRTYLFPDRSKVADDAGIVYATDNLGYINSLNGAFTDMTFAGDIPIVLRNSAVVGYSKAFLETGRYQLQGTPLRVFFANGSVFAFYRGDTRGVWATRVPLSLLNPPPAGTPIDPNGLHYTPDSYAFSNDGILYLLNKGTSSIFRWSTTAHKYLATITVAEAPQFMAYSETNRALYLAYASGKITAIRVDETLKEVPFANLPQAPLGLSTAGEFVLGVDGSGAWATHYVFTAEGALSSSQEWNYVSSEYVWSGENRKMYFFGNVLSWENIDLEGKLGAEREAGNATGNASKPPIRVAPGGAYLLLGSGLILKPITLELSNSLSNDIDDAAWLGDKLFTFRLLDGKSQIQAWTNTLGISKTVNVPGTPLRLYAAGTSLLAVTNVDGVPVFRLLNSVLQTTFQSPMPAPRLANVSTRAKVGTGDHVVIGGFIVTGSEPKKIMLRGIGPSLAGIVAEPLDDPRLDLFDVNTTLVASNRNWQDTQWSEIANTGIAPTDGREAAIITTLAPGFYTFALSGENGTTGAGVIEAYDLSSGSNSTVANISTRGSVGTGDDVMIAGFILAGGSGASTNVLVRGMGPSLPNVSGALPNPAVEIRDSNGALVAANDDWQTTQKADLEAIGLAPTNNSEAAIIQKITAGSYTVLLKPADQVGGIGLIEVYNLD